MFQGEETFSRSVAGDQVRLMFRQRSLQLLRLSRMSNDRKSRDTPQRFDPRHATQGAKFRHICTAGSHCALNKSPIEVSLRFTPAMSAIGRIYDCTLDNLSMTSPRQVKEPHFTNMHALLANSNWSLSNSLSFASIPQTVSVHSTDAVPGGYPAAKVVHHMLSCGESKRTCV